MHITNDTLGIKTVKCDFIYHNFNITSRSCNFVSHNCDNATFCILQCDLFLIFNFISQILLFLYKYRRKQASIENKIKIKWKYYIKSLHFGLCCKLGFDKPHIIHQMNKNSKKRKKLAVCSWTQVYRWNWVGSRNSMEAWTGEEAMNELMLNQEQNKAYEQQQVVLKGWNRLPATMYTTFSLVYRRRTQERLTVTQC